MPVITDITLALDMEQLKYRQGIGMPDKAKPEVTARSRELLIMVEEQHLLHPAIAYEIHTVAGIKHDQVSLTGGNVLHSQPLASSLAKAKTLGIAIYTIGAGLEEMVSDLFQRHEPLKATLLDGIGNAFLDSLSRHVCQIMGREAASRGYRASGPLMPGLPGWGLSDQAKLFRLVPAGEAGIRLTSQSMMVPRKSLSAVFGLGVAVVEWTPVEACRRCSMKDICPYRLRT